MGLDTYIERKTNRKRSNEEIQEIASTEITHYRNNWFWVDYFCKDKQQRDNSYVIVVLTNELINKCKEDIKDALKQRSQEGIEYNLDILDMNTFRDLKVSEIKDCLHKYYKTLCDVEVEKMDPDFEEGLDEIVVTSDW